MAELAMLSDIQRTVYPEEVTRQLHAKESSPIIHGRSNHCDTPLNLSGHAENSATLSLLKTVKLYSALNVHKNQLDKHIKPQTPCITLLRHPV